MWIVYLIFTIAELASLACISYGTYSAGYQKAKEEKIKDLSVLLWVVGGFILLICVPISSLIIWDTARRTAARQHLNEPIISEMQLYGYKIFGARHFIEKASFDSPEESKYFIDIYDLLSSYLGVFIDVEVSEEFYNEKVKKGKSYLPESEPNEPTPQEPNEPNEQKAETNVSAFLLVFKVSLQTLQFLPHVFCKLR